MGSVSGGFLLDTNVLVYAHDPRDVAKQERALLVLDQLIQHEQAVLSVQCLSEFFSVATNRLPEPLTPAQALDQVSRFARSCRVVDLTPWVVLEGCRVLVARRISTWPVGLLLAGVSASDRAVPRRPAGRW